MNTQEIESDSIRTSVREHYGQVATRGGGCGCAPTCCGTTERAPATERSANEVSQSLGYSAEHTGAVQEGANLGLGCGNPLAIALLKPGQTVLDLGSGAGFDAFFASNAWSVSVRTLPSAVSCVRLHRILFSSPLMMSTPSQAPAVQS